MKKDDPQYVVKLERAIEKKYGSQAIQNPKSTWTQEKERDYLEQSKQFHKKIEQNEKKSEKESRDGFLVSKRFLSNNSNRSCPTCRKYSLSFQDDVYFTKYNCCFECFVKYIEGREDRWLSGWRPNNTKAFND